MKEQTIKTISRESQSMSVLESLAEVFSTILEEEVTPVQSFHIMHAMLAFVVLVFSGSLPLLAQFMLLIWFCVAGYSMYRSVGNLL